MGFYCLALLALVRKRQGMDSFFNKQKERDVLSVGIMAPCSPLTSPRLIGEEAGPPWTVPPSLTPQQLATCSPMNLRLHYQCSARCFRPQGLSGDRQAVNSALRHIRQPLLFPLDLMVFVLCFSDTQSYVHYPLRQWWILKKPTLLTQSVV